MPATYRQVKEKHQSRMEAKGKNNNRNPQMNRVSGV